MSVMGHFLFLKSSIFGLDQELRQLEQAGNGPSRHLAQGSKSFFLNAKEHHCWKFINFAEPKNTRVNMQKAQKLFFHNWKL